MTRVCLIGKSDVTLQYELLSRETSREALSTYDLHRPFQNSLAIDTVSVGAALTFCNDLQWYIVRFVDEVLVREPSVSETEWLSRELASALRNGDAEPDETGEYLKIYGLERPSEQSEEQTAETPALASPVDGAAEKAGSSPTDSDGKPAEPSPAVSEDEHSEQGAGRQHAGRLVEPLYARRTDGEVPTYDLREVDETVIVQITEGEYAP